MKEVLVVYYTQTGQLLDILNNMVKPFNADKVNITYHKIELEKPFPFPWTKDAFYNAFPESFHQVPAKLKEPNESVFSKKYDLVVLGYQVWFLTPSVPINSFLKSDAAQKLLSDTPVITVVACRNMWIQAQEKVKRLLKKAEANLVGHIALVDRNVNHISVITIAHWMFSGDKSRMWGVFPKPGVSDKDIKEVSRFSPLIEEALLSNTFVALQEKLLELKAVVVNPFLVKTDERGNFVFSKWAALLTKKGEESEAERNKWINYFKKYLFFAIWVIAPIVFVVFLITYLPTYKKRKREKEYYSSVYLKEN